MDIHFRCPVCQEQLQQVNHSLVCTGRHTYDLSAEGYVNLLLSKHSKNPGDGKEMVSARTTFLNKGYYEPLAQEISRICASLSPNGVFVDAGCGDGYYLSQIAKQCPNATLAGIDISKDAVRTAAKRLKNAQFAVANCFDLPFADGKADILLQIFAPASDAEFRRVLKPSGNLISVIPGKSHLFGLKELLYENPYENDEETYSLPSFKIVSQRRIQYDITVDGADQIQNLFLMTPYYWRTKGKGGGLDGVSTLHTPAEFIITVYQYN